MDREKRKNLIENHKYTYDGGVPCVVGGYGVNDSFASLSPATGGHFYVQWDALERASMGDHDIPMEACWGSVSGWLGYMTVQEADVARAAWRQKREAKNGG